MHMHDSGLLWWSAPLLLGPAVAAYVLHISQSYVCVHASRTASSTVALHCSRRICELCDLCLLMQMAYFSYGVIGFAVLRVSPSSLFESLYMQRNPHGLACLALVGARSERDLHHIPCTQLCCQHSAYSRTACPCDVTTWVYVCVLF
jgi:hypothetical protein